MQDVSCEPLMLQLPEKSLKQAWIFSVSHIITLSGSYINRKAINKNKPSLSRGFLFYHGSDGLNGWALCVIRQKHQKPLAVDARCLSRAIDAVPV